MFGYTIKMFLTLISMKIIIAQNFIESFRFSLVSDFESSNLFFWSYIIENIFNGVFQRINDKNYFEEGCHDNFFYWFSKKIFFDLFKFN